MASKNKRKVLVSLITTISIIVLLVGAFFIYCGVYYHADKDAVNSYVASQNITREQVDKNTIVFKGDSVSSGLIFYPGGKVEWTAYEPLMAACAKRGIFCVLLKMPLNLAIFKSNAAKGIKERFPEVNEWYLCGHSLGGSMAASYLSKNINDYKGIIFLGSYSTSDISSSKVLSIYGSEDKVMNKKNYDKNKSNLPSNFTERIIQGGCHAYYGMYGYQRGDGTPTISNIEQIEITANYIRDFILI